MTVGSRAGGAADAVLLAAAMPVNIRMNATAADQNRRLRSQDLESVSVDMGNSIPTGVYPNALLGRASRPVRPASPVQPSGLLPASAECRRTLRMSRPSDS